MIRLRLRIFGVVQGVGFRMYAQREARALGLAGWVRNCPDGSVECEVQGQQAEVDEFVSWAHGGPPSAVVDQVDVSQVAVDPQDSHFRVVA